MEISSWILILLASALGFYLGQRWQLTRQMADEQADRPDFSLAYLEGVNLLLNEQGDDAIEALLPLLNVHPEMAETHLSLGRAFRKRGEFQHAIRVHENLLKHAADASHKQQAFLELAQDYLKAGLLDRAEHAFRSVLQNQPDDLTALRALAELFELQHDWENAIEVRQRLVALGYAEEKIVIAILYCEIAEAYLEQQALQDASRALRMAYESDPDSSRGTLLAGRLAFSAGQTEQALTIWRALLETRPEAFGLVLDDFLVAVDRLENPDLKREIRLQLACSQLPRHLSPRVADWLARQVGRDQATAYLYQQAQQDTATLGDLKAVLRLSRHSQIPPGSAQGCQDIEDLVDLLPERSIVYQCFHCGYRSPSHYWKCPGCRQWDTMRSQGEMIDA